jgi:fructose-bisphosphate aldolase class II
MRIFCNVQKNEKHLSLYKYNMLTSLSSVLEKAKLGNYAVGAFNVNNLEMIQAIMTAAETEKSPIIISTSEGAIEYAGMDELGTLAHLAAVRSKLPIVFHLDHGKNIKLVEQAIKSGWYTSIMFDGSTLPYKENLKTTKRLVEMAHRRGISVEAELGAIAGIEDFVTVESRDAHFTDPQQAREFVEKTKCDALAIAIGTSHGAYKFKETSTLDFKRLQKIRSLVKIPLVLHGASGIPANVKKICIDHGCKIEDAKGVSDAHIKKAVSLGINKVNIDSDLRIAFDAGVRRFLAENPEVIDPRKILGPAKDLITQVVRQKMKMLGSVGKG